MTQPTLILLPGVYPFSSSFLMTCDFEPKALRCIRRWRMLAVSAILIVAIGSVSSGQQPVVDLIREDFSRFPDGMLSAPVGYQNPAIQEYHYLAHRGTPLQPWSNVFCYLDAWKAGTNDGKHFLEQVLAPGQNRMAPKLLMPIFLTGDSEWSDYSVEVSVQPSSTEELAGVVFRYHTNRHHYVFGMQGGDTVRLTLKQPLDESFRVASFREIASSRFEYDSAHAYRLRVENEGDEIRCFVDDKLLIRAADGEIKRGKVGFGANIPAKFSDFQVRVQESTKKGIDERIRNRERELTTLQAMNPKPKLWKKFETPEYGAGRNVRFGDLDGDGMVDLLIGQNIPKTDSDAAVELSCVTAVTLNGTVLWQIGKPDPTRGLLTSDTPFQIHDVDGDGRNEVVLARERKLQILEGHSGQLKKFIEVPKVESYPSVPQKVPDNWPTDVSSGDSIAFANFSGNADATDIVLKDRYWNFWVFNNSLKLLWKGQGMLGHYPYVVPGKQGSRDQLATGYALWNADGKQLWSVDDQMRDHADGIVVADLSGDSTALPLAYYACSDDGVLIVDMNGIIRKQIRLGHAQTSAIGKFREDVPGLQYMCINFWKNPGIVTLLTNDGQILEQEEPIHSGSPMLPVNWRGDGIEFVLLSGNVNEGGMIDGHLRRVVMFPDDGHPDLCAAALDLTGDVRDEIVLWDTQRVWIYTQDRAFEGDKIYAPVRNPSYNDSNYRTSISVPQ
jgi:rhamnogalacturonan endolyase